MLIVEDDASIAAQLVRGLTRGGYLVDHVMTGNDALSQGDKAGAITAWRNFLVENPFSTERASVIALMAEQGAAPTDQNSIESAAAPPAAAPH